MKHRTIIASSGRVVVAVVIMAAFMAGLGACSSEQAYSAGQAMRQERCVQLRNMDDRRRCMDEANRPYDSYKQEADGLAAKKASGN